MEKQSGNYKTGAAVKTGRVHPRRQSKNLRTDRNPTPGKYSIVILKLFFSAHFYPKARNYSPRRVVYKNQHWS